MSLAFAVGPSASAAEPEEALQCLETDGIESHTIETDQRIRFYMKSGDTQIMILKPHCPQLHFHDYFSFTPVNGHLCAGEDEIKTRAGLPCQIDRIEKAEKEALKEPKAP